MNCDFCTSPARYGMQVEGAKLPQYVCAAHLVPTLDECFEYDPEADVAVWKAFAALCTLDP